MGQIGLNVAVDRLTRTSDQYANRLARLRSDVQSALADLEAMVRAEATGLGVPERELEESAGVLVGVVVRTAVEGVVQHSRQSAQTARRMGVPPVPVRDTSDT
jgi:hypothetical protein